MNLIMMFEVQVMQDNQLQFFQFQIQIRLKFKKKM